MANEAERRRFKKSALPWTSSLIAKSPSLVSSEPNPNENAANDGTLTACQQLACKDTGPSILAPGSKYGAVKINRSAGDSRKAHFVGDWQEFPGRDHYDGVEGSFDDDGFNNGDRTMELMADHLIARTASQVEARRKESRTVLTDQDKAVMRLTLSPNGGTEYASAGRKAIPYTTVPQETYHFLVGNGHAVPPGSSRIGPEEPRSMIGSGESTRTSEKYSWGTWVYAGSWKGLADKEFVGSMGSGVSSSIDVMTECGNGGSRS